MITDTLKKIREVTTEYTTIEVKFTTNSICKVKDGRTPSKSEVSIKWILYISDITTKGNNSFPEFNTFEQLDSYVNILCIELKRIKQSAVKDAVEIAMELFKMEGLK